MRRWMGVRRDNNKIIVIWTQHGPQDPEWRPPNDEAKCFMVEFDDAVEPWASAAADMPLYIWDEATSQPRPRTEAEKEELARWEYERTKEGKTTYDEAEPTSMINRMKHIFTEDELDEVRPDKVKVAKLKTKLAALELRVLDLEATIQMMIGR